MSDYWVLNTKTKKYESSRSEPLSVFPTIVNAKDRIVFCRRCHRWEYIIRFRDDVLISQCGQPYKGMIVQNGTQLNYGFEMNRIRGSLCNELTEQILDEMGERYKKQFGLKPTVASKLRGFSVLIGYMLSPFNVNFYRIAQHWGLNPYDREFASLSCRKHADCRKRNVRCGWNQHIRCLQRVSFRTGKERNYARRVQ